MVFMSYDPSEYDWSADPEPEPATSKMHVPADVLPNVPEAETDELDEVERRLEKAHYYRMLLKHQLISSDSNEAVEVEQEIQDFVRERLAVLLGIKQERGPEFDLGQMSIMLKQNQPFSDDEVEALKAVAAKVLNRPTIVQAKPEAPKPPPSIKPLAESPIKKGGVNREFQIKQRPPDPEPIRPAVEAPKPVVPPPEPPKRPRGRPRKVQAAPVAAPLQKTETAPQKEEETGERIKVVGAKRYKVVDRVVNDPATGQPKLDAKGNKVTAEYLIDITPKAEVPGKTPFPSLEVMNAMEAVKAQEAMSMNPLAQGLIPTAMTLPDTTQKD